MGKSSHKGYAKLRPPDVALAGEIDQALRAYESEERSLPGIQLPTYRDAYVEQVLESIRRVKYVSVIRGRSLSPLRADPSSDLFDPLKASILLQSEGRTDESYWMVFLFVHFGKNARGGWRYAREVYSGLSDSVMWDWASTSSDPAGFREWLADNEANFRRKGVPGGFGNHRKYQSLDAYSANGTGAAFESYVDWVAPPRTHQELILETRSEVDGNPQHAFDRLYESMDAVASFGRTARFDYLTMLGKLGLAEIEPGSPYLPGSSGPLEGARLLYGSDESPARLDSWLLELDDYMRVGFQVIEDSLCNWQKSPSRFVPFRE